VLVAAAGLPVTAGVVVAVAAGSPAASGALAGAVVVTAPLLVTHVAAPSGLGFGDVKAGVVFGAALGLVNPVLAVAGLMIGLFVSAAWALGARRGAVPLGPGLLAGGITAFAAGRMLGVAPW
jgi:leader peptidase (prepilin peptidase)/N-methyltransferase